MLEVKCNKGVEELKVTGNIREIHTDVLCVIHSVYEAVRETNVDAAESFKDNLIKNVDVAFKTNEDLKEELGKDKDTLKYILNKLLESMDEEYEEDEEEDADIHLES